MTEEERLKARLEGIERSNRIWFPERYAETRFELPSGLGEPTDPRVFFAEIVGLSMNFARDRRNSVYERTQALDLARKAALDQMKIVAAWSTASG